MTENSFRHGTEIDLRIIIYNLFKSVARLAQRISLVNVQGQSLIDSELPLVSNFSQQLHLRELVSGSKRARQAFCDCDFAGSKRRIDLARRADLVIEEPVAGTFSFA
jgi:hypothetical protein